MKHSRSLALVWQIADIEARNLKAPAIECMHLLIGLCKVVDLDLVGLVSKEVDPDKILEELLREIRRLRTVFRAAGLDARMLRRHLRRVYPEQRLGLDRSKRLHRSSEAKRIFANAEQFGQLGSGKAYPVHLLYATLLADDENRDVVLNKLKINKERLLTLVKKQVFKPQIGSASSSKRRRARWN
jgi:hypothetical protein